MEMGPTQSAPEAGLVMSLPMRISTRSALAIVMAAAFPLLSQEFRATLTGRVTDPSGATIAQAKIQAVNQSTQQAYNAITTDKGVYFIPYVLPGTYKVNVTAERFKTQVQDLKRRFKMT
jgi:hypothetical protein